MAIVMNMSGYEVEREVEAADEYGDEVMCAEWVPALAQMNDGHVVEMDKHTPFSPELAIADVDVFLEKMYRNQR
ncbi:MAG: hypothetical protein HZB47_14925 [Nitrosomonadales bacterium]|nr:hypothetical protein [Nitrosomonadales bacterium]